MTRTPFNWWLLAVGLIALASLLFLAMVIMSIRDAAVYDDLAIHLPITFLWTVLWIIIVRKFYWVVPRNDRAKSFGDNPRTELLARLREFPQQSR
jgi:hypothetical protein